MAYPCLGCRQHDLTLESFGVYRCPSCGRVDVDGRPIPDGASASTPIVRTSAASFAAPPPELGAPRVERAPLPPLLFAMIAVEAILSIASALGPGGNVIRLLFRLSVFGGLLTGKKASYYYAVLGLTLGLTLGLGLLLSTWSALPMMARLLYGLLAGIDVAFFGALLRDDARRHYLADRSI